METIVSQKMSRGQGNEFLNKLEAAGLSGELAQKVIDSKGNALASEVVRCILNFGKPAEDFYDFEAKYPESRATFVTSSYFVTRPGLWVSDDFASRITQAYPKALVPQGLSGIQSFDLTDDSSDKVILARPEMGGLENVRKHAITPDQLASLIDVQPRGVAGKLLTDGYANLFYMVGRGGALFVASVSWSRADSLWGICMWGLDCHADWDVGNRVFFKTQV